MYWDSKHVWISYGFPVPCRAMSGQFMIPDGLGKDITVKSQLKNKERDYDGK